MVITGSWGRGGQRKKGEPYLKSGKGKKCHRGEGGGVEVSEKGRSPGKGQRNKN